MRHKISAFENEMRKFGCEEGDQHDCPLKHTYADGVYVREIFIPKNKVLVGKIHKHSHPNFLMSGCVTVITESGGRERLNGPMSMISPAGTKRVVWAHSDTVWITVHVTDKTDVKQREEEVIVPDYTYLADESLQKITEVIK
jgi:hypothetical protein